nr:nitric oxide synthase oxygenase [Amycolatopsis sp. FDAARGOS 1241]
MRVKVNESIREDPGTTVEYAEAEEFVRLCAAEGALPGLRVDERLAQIKEEIAETGSYRHTQAELAYGARVAWRNSARCIGRLYGRSLRVRDRRHVDDAAGIAGECVTHLREATREGRIRPTLTVFARDGPAAPGPRIHNDQLIRYAGYRLEDGPVLGDPQYAGFTEAVQGLGWRGPERRVRSTCCRC